MKKILSVVILLLILVSVVGCGSNNIPAKPFETENISRISFRTSPDDWVEIPSEELPVYIEWLKSFRIGEKAGSTLVPGSNSVRIRIEYSDGTFIENGLSTIKVGNDSYYLAFDNAPDSYPDYIKWYDAFE